MNAQLRISQESAKLISSLDSNSRYILFKSTGDSHSAVICSQISDNELAYVLSGNSQPWLFNDRNKAIRSIRRLNKDVQIYTGSYQPNDNMII